MIYLSLVTCVVVCPLLLEGVAQAACRAFNERKNYD